MTATQAPDAPRQQQRPSTDPSRTGAVWVTGTGAFLLLAAAALFVAVRWAEIPPSAKLGAIGALTGAFLLAGRRLRPSLPATSSALFHLGAFLIPVDVAALAVRAELGWAATLLAEGLVCGVTFTLASRSEGSVVLRWAAAASVVVAAAGLGAAGPVPAPVVLALAAAGALFSFRVQEGAHHALPCTQNGSGVAAHERLSVAWAGVAGLAPLAGLVLDAGRLAPGVVERLGLAGDQPRLAAAVTGAVTAGVLATVARRRLDPALALLAAVCALVGLGLTGAHLDPSPWGWAIGACAVLLAVELAGLLLRHDPFWSSPAGQAAVLAEVFAVPGSLCAAGVVAFSPFLVVRSTSGAAAVGLLALAWVVADVRRRPGAGTSVGLAILLGGRFAPATMGVAACVPAAVAMATGSGPLTGVSLVATAAALAAGGRPLAARTAVAATLVAPHAVLGRQVGDLLSAEPAPDPSTGVLLTVAAAGFAGSLLLARMVSWRAPLADAPEPTRVVTWLLAAAAPLPVLLAALRLGEETGERGALLVLAVGLAWLAAAAADAVAPAQPRTALTPATATRTVALAVVLGQCRNLDAVEALVVAGLAAAFVLLDAMRLDEPRLAFALVAALPATAIAAGTVAELSVPRAGVTLAVAAVVVAGLGSLLSQRWRDPVLASAGALAGVGLVLASGEATALADALLVTGGVAVTAGLGWSRLDVVVAGGGAVTLGMWARLVDAGVDASEPYVAPIAAVLLLAGLLGKQDEASSWVTTGPAVALLGGAALVERLGGGGGWHALVAGTVGVTAVAAGGRWRLGAPLLVGTGLLVALVGHESLAVTAGVPTWGWLALGGSTLLGIGITLERAERGPLETGRRLVDVVQQRYR
ncbi:MAG: hypothetical protein WD232_09465 [Acidimicrobiales bacterium]